jgi:hypothetical protein
MSGLLGKTSSEQNGHRARLVVAVVEDHQKVGAWRKPARTSGEITLDEVERIAI